MTVFRSVFDCLLICHLFDILSLCPFLVSLSACLSSPVCLRLSECFSRYICPSFYLRLYLSSCHRLPLCLCVSLCSSLCICHLSLSMYVRVLRDGRNRRPTASVSYAADNDSSA